MTENLNQRWTGRWQFNKRVLKKWKVKNGKSFKIKDDGIKDLDMVIESELPGCLDVSYEHLFHVEPCAHCQAFVAGKVNAEAF